MGTESRSKPRGTITEFDDYRDEGEIEEYVMVSLRLSVHTYDSMTVRCIYLHLLTALLLLIFILPLF